MKVLYFASLSAIRAGIKKLQSTWFNVCLKYIWYIFDILYIYI